MCDQTLGARFIVRVGRQAVVTVGLDGYVPMIWLIWMLLGRMA